MPRFFLKQCRTAGVAAVALCFQTRAAAQSDELRAPQPDEVRIEYRAPPECPDFEAFKGLVRTRAPGAWEAGPGEVARRVIVDVSGAEGRYTATVELADEDEGEGGAKTVSGTLCADVVDGIALVTALAIQSRGQEESALSEPAAAPVAASPTGAPAPAATAPAPTEPAAARAAAATREERPSTARDARSSASFRVSARATLATGVGPSAAAGAGLGVVFEPRGARLGIALQGVQTGRVEAHGVSARFELLSARLEGCPFVLVLADWASVEPCPFAELGAVTGEAFEDAPTVVRGNRGSAPWYSAGGVGRAVGRFGWFVVELEVLLGAPLRRERFYIERGDEIHRVPAYYGAAAAGLGVRF